MKYFPNLGAVLFTVLALLMIATRGSHFESAIDLPAASLAVFFLAGFYFRSTLPAFALLAVAVGLDIAAVKWGGVSAECFGPAYPFLGLAYLVLWAGGRWVAFSYVARPAMSASIFATLIIATVVSSLIAHLISSGSFYALSGSFDSLSFAEFGKRVVLYYPHSLKAMAVYVGGAAVIHALCLLNADRKRADESL